MKKKLRGCDTMSNEKKRFQPFLAYYADKYVLKNVVL